jgi:hypothetical protein
MIPVKDPILCYDILRDTLSFAMVQGDNHILISIKVEEKKVCYVSSTWTWHLKPTWGQWCCSKNKLCYPSQQGKKIIEIICALYYTQPLLQSRMRSCWTMQQICRFKNTILNSFVRYSYSLMLVTITTSMVEPCSKYAG